jgi:hypothetical protein
MFAAPVGVAVFLAVIGFAIVMLLRPRDPQVSNAVILTGLSTDAMVGPPSGTVALPEPATASPSPTSPPPAAPPEPTLPSPSEKLGSSDTSSPSLGGARASKSAAVPVAAVKAARASSQAPPSSSAQPEKVAGRPEGTTITPGAPAPLFIQRSSADLFMDRK